MTSYVYYLILGFAPGAPRARAVRVTARRLPGRVARSGSGSGCSLQWLAGAGMEEDAVPVILLVVGFEENPADPTDVSALVLQCDASGEAQPAAQSISQEGLDELINSGRMPVR